MTRNDQRYILIYFRIIEGGSSRLKARMLEVFATCLFVAISLSCSHPQAQPAQAQAWSPKAAAAYLDSRTGLWVGWIGAASDHDTFCISCHTPLPYVLSRPALRVALGEQGWSLNERRVVDNVVKRVRLWKDVGPYYNDQGYGHGKTAESRGTESVLNALILASHDAQSGRLSDETRAAFDNMWALQQTTGDNRGAWLWLQFDAEPWEANDSPYYGAALAAIAVGTAPENYGSRPEIQDNLTHLREYLKRQRSDQSIINRVFLLWASAKLPGILAPEQRESIIHEVLTKQQADGGWRLASLTWRWNGWTLRSLVKMWLREDGTPLAGNSDGVATGLVTLALQQAGVARENPQLKRGLSWLVSNQNPEGFWPASSLNKKRNPTSNTGRFMSDAATAYAVLALTANQPTPAESASIIAGRRRPSEQERMRGR